MLSGCGQVRTLQRPLTLLLSVSQGHEPAVSAADRSPSPLR